MSPLMDRRDFLRMIEGALAAAGLSGCTLQPPERSLPYVVQPEDVVPGRPLFYATSVPFSGYGIGVLGECHMGRPIKLDGHPGHPASLGGSDAFMQAAVLSLYDPDRSRNVVHQGSARTWADFLPALQARLALQKAVRGKGLRVLTGTTTSPTLAAQLQALLTDFPEARWVRFEPVDAGAERAGTSLAFGRPLSPVPRLAGARRILALDADFLYGDPAAVRHARDFADGRSKSPAGMTRLYALEPTLTVTGGNADHRLTVAASQVGDYARAAARRLLGQPALPAGSDGLQEGPRRWLDAAVDDLKAHPGASLVLAGRGQPAQVHALAHLMNHALGAVGRSIDYIESPDAALAAGVEELSSLAEDMRAGRVDTLVILGSNPAYAAPGDVPFAAALAKVPFSVHLGLYHDETAELCTWHVPEAHALESWGDLRAYDGTVSLQQPLIRPLYAGRTAAEFIGAARGVADGDGLALLRKQWTSHDHGFRGLIKDGIIPGTTAAPVAVTPVAGAAEQHTRSGKKTEGGPLSELVFRPDPSAWDGRHANNGWLQELPKPYLTLTWDNAALFSPAHAARLGIATGDVVRLRLGAAEAEAPALVLPGQADGSVTVSLGYGRRKGGKLAEHRGFDAYRLRKAAAPWVAPGVEVTRTGGSYPLAMTQNHHTMEGREPARAVTAAELTARPGPVQAALSRDEPPRDDTLYPPMPTGDYSWGMSIDLNRCIGCNACTAACQAENNVPVVGKEEVARGREMHWIRVDRYFVGDQVAPEVRFQPVTCMHCEKAPCEVVCPVGATVHDSEGLNEMVYNRCVGTRYCSNNCPYKVRRFNFFGYSKPDAPVAELVFNPDVTVRERGVMEKCTYCVQRINGARIEAEKEGRRIRDGEVVPACAAACPTKAIVFGNVADPHSAVALAKAGTRNYDLLAELNTRPRTSYLAKVLNPNPAMPVVP